MRIRAAWTIATLYLLLLSSQVIADDGVINGTGNQLITLCNEKSHQAQNTNWNYCIAYVDGVTDGYVWSGSLVNYLASQDSTIKTDKDAYAKLLNLYTHWYCIPNNVTRQQMALVVSKYLSDNPELLNQPSADLVIGAVAKAWPCNKN